MSTNCAPPSASRFRRFTMAWRIAHAVMAAATSAIRTAAVDDASAEAAPKGVGAKVPSSSSSSERFVGERCDDDDDDACGGAVGRVDDEYEDAQLAGTQAASADRDTTPLPPHASQAAPMHDVPWSHWHRGQSVVASRGPSAMDT
jgi:hypothetical protein